MSSLNLKLKSLFPSRAGEKSASGIKRITLSKIVKYDKQGKITLEYLKRILRYEPDTGDWIWLTALSKKIEIGDKAGWRNEEYGYIQLRIDTKLYLGHVLAWFYMTGEWPKGEVDHIDLNKTNDKWLNFRLITHQQNNFNKGVNINNTSGFKGVSWDKKSKKFAAYIKLDYKKMHLGYFESKIDAAQAYDRAAIKYFGAFARLNFPLGDYLNG